MKIRFGDAAQYDLQTVLLALAAVDPDRAKLTSRALRACVRSIGLAPMLGPTAGIGSAIRKRRMPPYLFLYEIRATEILILRIVHERSDWASLI